DRRVDALSPRGRSGAVPAHELELWPPRSARRGDPGQAEAPAAACRAGAGGLRRLDGAARHPLGGAGRGGLSTSPHGRRRRGVGPAAGRTGRDRASAERSPAAGAGRAAKGEAAGSEPREAAVLREHDRDAHTFLEHIEHERQLSPRTVRAYADDLAELQQFLTTYYGTPEWTWGGVDRLAIRSFMGDCVSRRGLSKRTIARKLSAIRTFFRFLHLEELVEANPARAVRSPRLERTLPGFLTREQVERIFDMAEARAMEGDPAAVRNLAIVELFYSTGIRLSELQQLDVDDVDLVSERVR